MLLCGISRQLRHEELGFDDVISQDDEDFAASGLLTTSLIRLGFLALLPRGEARGAIGAISSKRHHRLLRRLAEHLLQPTVADP